MTERWRVRDILVPVVCMGLAFIIGRATGGDAAYSRGHAAGRHEAMTWVIQRIEQIKAERAAP